MRQFYLRNGNGAEYSLMDVQHWLNSPKGLGLKFKIKYSQVGPSFIKTKTVSNPQNPTGTVIFTGNKLYDKYQEFVLFTQVEPLILVYNPNGTEYIANVSLEEIKKDPAAVRPGEEVIVLGGGNTAMDVARAAIRLPGVKKVSLVYRRTKRYMPADEEELQMALEDGVEFMELLAPERLQDGQLICHVMKLGEPDASGRRSPVDTGEVRQIPADTVIAAVGERVDTALFETAGCAIDTKGRPAVDSGMKTSIEGIYAIGDARRGPATVVEGIADAQAAAASIAGIRFDGCEGENSATPENAYLFKKGRVAEDLSVVPDWRCLGCPSVCEVCADVCPNRANVVIHVPGRRQAQILHVDGMCNECGNCAVFCPYNGKPYRDKFTLFRSEEDFADSENEGFLPVGADSVKVRLDGQEETVQVNNLEKVSGEAAEMIRTVMKDYGYLIHHS